MERLCDDVLQLIFYELTDPGSLTMVSKRFYQFSQVPYVRAHYFLTRYGPTQAMFQALGRGKILTERVLDILMTSGAHLSRYLIQVAFHHYFHTRSHFIKTPWVRTVPLSVFTYFLKLAADTYGDIPRGKSEDDGTIFTWFLQESRFPPQARRVNWETVRDILDKYNFIPFSHKDPLMAQFPLALALEPRLLPYAVSNGFFMDSKYRNFIFRKMFEKVSERSVDDVVNNVKELCRLDPTMYVSRTVAAEVCMEAKYNAHGYAALKQLNKSGNLLFDLPTLVEDLLKTQEALQHLYADFPSSDPVVRLVMLMTVFTSGSSHANAATIQERLDTLKIGVLTKTDLYNLLINPYTEKYRGLIEYMTKGMISEVTGQKGMTTAEVTAIVQEVTSRCMEIESKGKMLKKLCEEFSCVRGAIIQSALGAHQVHVADLPDDCSNYHARLCRSYFRTNDDNEYFWNGRPNREVIPHEGRDEGCLSSELASSSSAEGVGRETVSPLQVLGQIGQEPLSAMIRQDELTPARSRRRMIFDTIPVIPPTYIPHDQMHVAKWIKAEFGPRSSVTAVFMTHAIINENSVILNDYLGTAGRAQRVPITFKHFQILARLRRAPCNQLYRDIESGAEFFLSEDEYIPKSDNARKLYSKVEVKKESSPANIPVSSMTPERDPASGPPRGRKRPRRITAVTVRSYVVPGSDDEAIAVEDDEDYDMKMKQAEGNLRLWVKHLGELLKTEQAKHQEQKRKLTREAGPGARVRVYKNEFFRSLSTHLRLLRKIDEDKRKGLDCTTDHSLSDVDDDDYYCQTVRSKRRRTSK
ncbi:uncharacterized protein EV420DRAFT_1618363 [Desarmillaria tabescens]|uniref:Uncharacterized protein n=1 Tax=Armillaria tabescens TaxID=1929756 RepID=A0AA39NF73_ARMTA|nr:uncharacterized protein EV420DRAFT_1618363 [Desarmillaria tabescens]KAK0464542.1 hypothetical protein EV420DRAFT_1618363 [Desarmillaria tabescens]